MNKDALNIFNSLQKIAWHFGNHRLNGGCFSDLSLVEFIALKEIYGNSNLSIQDIGAALRFTKSVATRIIDRMETKGYVKRRRSPIDGRVCCASITAKGTEAIEDIMKRYTVCIEGMLEGLTPEKIGNIKDVLGFLSESIHKQNII